MATSDLTKEDVKNIGREFLQKETTKTFKDVGIEKTGTKIIIPKGMSYVDAVEWILKTERAEETEISIMHEINCFPLEGALALKKALEHVFGFIDLKAERSFFGSRPPLCISVPTGPHTHEQAYWGNLQPPALEGGYIQTSIGGDGFRFVISGKIKRKFEKVIAAVAEIVQDYIKKNSIYKGKAIRVNLDYMREDSDRGFDVMSDSPIFMDLTGIDENDLIVNEKTKLSLTTSLFMRIEHSKHCLEHGIPLKSGLLLMGPYGTGKTMTARVTAQKAVKNNWTFIYLENCKDLANGLRLGELYAPSVIFAEDIDKATEGNRSEDLNKILNTLDGIDTKDKPIITVLTTNHEENITRAFLRPGRIDTTVNMGPFEKEAAIRFIKRFMVNENGDSLLEENADFETIGAGLENLVPAFISEVINRAKMYAIAREGSDVVGKVRTTDVLTSIAAIKEHVDLVSGKQNVIAPIPITELSITLPSSK